MGVYEYFSIYCIIKSWEDFMLDNLVDNRKLEKYNELLQQFDGDHEKMMAWAKEKANKETNLYVQTHGKVTVEFSKSLYHSLSSITNLSTLFP